jgi:transcriptional regulator with XRE-family HTH domain
LAVSLGDMTVHLPAVIDETVEDAIVEAETVAHAQAVGARLRVVRHQLGWTLADVEARSNRHISASDLDAYERGDQAIPFYVFRRLVRAYGVTSEHLRTVSATDPVETDDDRTDAMVRQSIAVQAVGQVPSPRPVAQPLRAHCVEEVSLRCYPPESVVPIGTAVMVRTHYLGSWVSGFEIAELAANGYRLRRVSDGSVLGVVVAFDDVRPLSP